MGENEGSSQTVEANKVGQYDILTLELQCFIILMKILKSFEQSKGFIFG